MPFIPRLGDCCGQQRFRVRELIVLPQIKHSAVDLNVWPLALFRYATVQQGTTLLTVTWDRRLMVIFPLSPPIARNRSSGESAIEQMSSACWMRPSWVCADASQNVTVRFVECAMNSPCVGRAMRPKSLPPGTSHCETTDPVDGSICLILLSETTKRCAFDQRRPVLIHPVTFTGISTSKRRSLLS